MDRLQLYLSNMNKQPS